MYEILINLSFLIMLEVPSLCEKLHQKACKIIDGKSNIC